MFKSLYEWDDRRKLNKKLIEVVTTEGHSRDDANELYRQLDCLIDRKRFRAANKYNIQIQKEWLKSTHDDNSKYPSGIVYRFSQSALIFWLTEEGRAELDSIIKQKRRENWEWLVTKIIVPITGLVLGLASSIIAILALLYKK